MQAAVAAARATAAGEPLPDLPELKALKVIDPGVSKTGSKLKPRKGGVAKRKGSLGKSASKQLSSDMAHGKSRQGAASSGAASKKYKGKSSKRDSVSGDESAGTPVKAEELDMGDEEVKADSDDLADADGLAQGLVGIFAPTLPICIAPAVTGPSAEEGDADGNCPLPNAWLQLRGCPASEESPAAQLSGAGPHPPYPSERGGATSGHASGGADGEDRQPARQVTQRRVRSRPGGPAVEATAVAYATAADTQLPDISTGGISASDAPEGSKSTKPASANGGAHTGKGSSTTAAAKESAEESAGQTASRAHQAAASTQAAQGRAATPAAPAPPQSVPQQPQIGDQQLAAAAVEAAAKGKNLSATQPPSNQQAGPAAAAAGAGDSAQQPQSSQPQQSFQPPPFDPFQHPQQQQTALLAHFASLPLHQWGDALGDYQRQALASLASNISAVQQVLAQASMLQTASTQGRLQFLHFAPSSYTRSQQRMTCHA